VLYSASFCIHITCTLSRRAQTQPIYTKPFNLVMSSVLPALSPLPKLRFSRSAALTCTPRRTTTIAELRSANASHVRASLEPFNHPTAAGAALPPVLQRDVGNSLAVQALSAREVTCQMNRSAAPRAGGPAAAWANDRAGVLRLGS